MALVVKYPPANEEDIRSLGGEDPLEEGMATQLQYSCLENPMNRGAWRATHSMGCKELGTTEVT